MKVEWRAKNNLPAPLLLHPYSTSLNFPSKSRIDAQEEPIFAFVVPAPFYAAGFVVPSHQVEAKTVAPEEMVGERVLSAVPRVVGVSEVVVEREIKFQGEIAETFERHIFSQKEGPVEKLDVKSRFEQAIIQPVGYIIFIPAHKTAAVPERLIVEVRWAATRQTGATFQDSLKTQAFFPKREIFCKLGIGAKKPQIIAGQQAVVAQFAGKKPSIKWIWPDVAIVKSQIVEQAEVPLPPVAIKKKVGIEKIGNRIRDGD